MEGERGWGVGDGKSGVGLGWVGGGGGRSGEVWEGEGREWAGRAKLGGGGGRGDEGGGEWTEARAGEVGDTGLHQNPIESARTC
jgi:hypothetical protein